MDALETANYPRGNHARDRRSLRFGPFELRLDTRELSKFGTRIRLQAKPAQILEVLATRPGELVRREELFERLWTTGTFVDFESGLNTAVNRLRAVLADTAESPRYIETIPRLGYRFICPVEDVRMEPLACGAEGGCEELVEWPMPHDSDTVPAAFGQGILRRLAFATMLALIVQCLFVYSHVAVSANASNSCSASLTALTARR